jgi:hypothetical protein
MASHTGFSNEQYNLISTLYHCLSGADSCEKFIQDARGADDSQLAGFSDEIKNTTLIWPEKRMK